MISYRLLLISVLNLISIFVYSQIDTIINTKFNTILENKWLGNREDFSVDSTLKLNAQNAGESYLSYPANYGNQIDLEFSLSMNFAPSKSNFFRYYLWADSSNLTKSTNSLFLEIGEDGSSDGINIYEIKSGKTILIKKCFEAQFAEEIINKVISIKTHKSNLIITTSNSRDSLTINSNIAFGYTGFICHYTVTRKDKYSINYLRLITETSKNFEPLGLVNTEILNSNNYFLTFNQDLSKYKLKENDQLLNFKIKNDTLQFQLKRYNREGFKIELIDSLNNHYSFQIDKHEIYQRPNIAISEIMHDPDPALFLPNFEYIELTNFSDTDVKINNAKICDLSTCINLPELKLPAKEATIITNATKSNFNIEVKNLVNIQNFLTLNNEGDIIKLYDQNNNLLTWIEYNPKWINSTSEGGKSIENHNKNSCLTKAINWDFSHNTLGGTPSLYNNELTKSITVSPKITEIKDSSITLSLGQLWNLESFDIENISLKNQIIKEYEFKNPDNITLHFNSTFENGQPQEITINNLKNCKDETIPIQLEFLHSEIPKLGELAINEIVQKSKSGVQFIELKNISNKSFSINKIYLGIFKNGNLSKILKSESYKILNPNDFIVYTNDTILINEYTILNKSKVEYVDFTLTKEFEIGILNELGELIEKLESSFLKEEENINPYPYASWERVSTQIDISTPNNWLKAGLNANYGTPTAENSSVNNSDQKDEIVFSTKIIKPNSIYVEENTLEISTNLTSDNWILNINLIDRNGNLIDRLYQNMPISSKGKLYWNGKAKTGKSLDEDLYIIIVELLNQNGVSKIIRKPIVIDQ